MSSFTENNLSDVIQGLLFRISTGEFGPPDTLSTCCEHLTHALSVTTNLNNQDDLIIDSNSSDINQLDNTLVVGNINNWICIYCTYENNISSNICEMCLKSKSNNGDNESIQIVNDNDVNDNDVNNNDVNNNMWECLHCTFINHSIIDDCSMCGKSKNDIQNNLAGFNVNNDLENEF